MNEENAERKERGKYLLPHAGSMTREIQNYVSAIRVFGEARESTISKKMKKKQGNDQKTNKSEEV